MSYRATYHLRSNDYYSSRNYASRLIGSKLVFYTPLYLNPWRGNPYDQLPAMRKWGAGEFQRIAPATRIYRSDEQLDPWQGMALHTVTVCDLAKRDLDCESTAVLGPPAACSTSRRPRCSSGTSKSAVFRIPLDGGAPSALKVAGSPVDQFSFLEGGDGFLNVLVRAHGRGEAMWSSEMRGGELALLRVHLGRFSDGRDSAAPESYQPLPGHASQNRFVGQYLLYGGQRQLFAVRYVDGSTFGLPISHAVDRLEALGDDAVAIGSDGRDLHFSSVRLAPYPVVAGRYSRPNANQGESRSHGFFYNERQGLLGLPIIGGNHRTMRHQLQAVLGVGALPQEPIAELLRDRHARRERRRKHQRRLPRLVRRLVRKLAAALHPQPRVRADGLRAGRGAAGRRRDRRDPADQLLSRWRISSRTGLR